MVSVGRHIKLSHLTQLLYLKYLQKRRHQFNIIQYLFFRDNRVNKTFSRDTRHTCNFSLLMFPLSYLFLLQDSIYCLFIQYTLYYKISQWSIVYKIWYFRFLFLGWMYKSRVVTFRKSSITVVPLVNWFLHIAY